VKAYIEMRIPESCWSCGLLATRNSQYCCSKTRQNILETQKGRALFCPLKPIPEQSEEFKDIIDQLQELMLDRESFFCSDTPEIYKADHEALDKALNLLKLTPERATELAEADKGARLVTVTRCKDCTWFHPHGKSDLGEQLYRCKITQWGFVDGNGYCSNAIPGRGQMNAVKATERR